MNDDSALSSPPATLRSVGKVEIGVGLLLVVITPFVDACAVTLALGSVLLVCGHVFVGFSYQRYSQTE